MDVIEGHYEHGSVVGVEGVGVAYVSCFLLGVNLLCFGMF